MAELQKIPARHGVATFVPAGRVIKIINTSGTQVVDTWAFALPKPEERHGEGEEKEQEQRKGISIDENEKIDDQCSSSAPARPLKKPNRSRTDRLPSQEEAEEATRQEFQQQPQAGAQTKQQLEKKSWSSYAPSLGNWSSTLKKQSRDDEAVAEQRANSRTWGSYFAVGKGFTSYIPKQATDTVSAFAASHQRNPNKPYLEQLQDFSRTPVGAAGLSAITGSGYSGSLYAAYQAWNTTNASNAPLGELLSMSHSRAATEHLRPRVNDTLVTNLRNPIITLIEDTSPGEHDTLIAPCDPQRYRQLNVEKWEEHGSCAENLVLALKELNTRAGLKGARSVGADVTMNNTPASLNLFGKLSIDVEGSISIDAPVSKAGDFVRFRAERDVVVVMSSCPQDVLETDHNRPTDAHFVVEDEPIKDSGATTKRPSQPRKSSARGQTPSSQSKAGTTSTRGKPAPLAVVPSKKGTPTAPVDKRSDAHQNNGEKSAERKKPRKLATRPKPS